jgi:hypothetical protein
MAEIWCAGKKVADQDYGRHPEAGDLLELAIGGRTGEYEVERKAVFYSRQGKMTERIFVKPC